MIPDWNEFLEDEVQEKEYQELCQHERTGRPLGSDLLIDKLEALLGKQLRKKMIGAKGPWKNMGSK
jgi:putative transposase